MTATGRHVTCKRYFVVTALIARKQAATKTRFYMSTLTVKGQWNIAKGKLKQKLAQLTDDDSRFARGKEEELIGRIQKRTGRATKKNEQILGEYCGYKH